MVETQPMTPLERRSRIQDEHDLDPVDGSMTTAELAEWTYPEVYERDLALERSTEQAQFTERSAA
jgi:hypothetical protein